ncbi:MAG: helix-turn-helix domain-containing protein, partial [Methyloceanibacter sp.]
RIRRTLSHVAHGAIHDEDGIVDHRKCTVSAVFCFLGHHRTAPTNFALALEMSTSRAGFSCRDPASTALVFSFRTYELLVMPEERRLYSIREAHELLNISRAKFYSLVSSQQIATVKIGSRRLAPREALEEFVRRLRKRGNITYAGD